MKKFITLGTLAFVLPVFVGCDSNPNGPSAPVAPASASNGPAPAKDTTTKKGRKTSGGAISANSLAD